MTKDEQKKFVERSRLGIILHDAFVEIDQALGRAEHEILSEPRARREYEAAATAVVSTLRFMMLAAREHMNRWF